MTAINRSPTPWGVLWRSDSALDGKVERLLGDTSHPSRRVLFETRHEARAYIENKYGYLRTRPDLRREPFGWRMPIPVRVTVTVERV
jgi:hypothetical protein